MPESKGQVVGERVSWPISPVEYGPKIFFPVTAADMLPGNTGWPPDGCLDRKCVKQGRANPCELALPGQNCVFLKAVTLSVSMCICRKLFSFIENRLIDK